MCSKYGGLYMLISADNGRQVTELPHKVEFDRWMSQLPEADYNRIVQALIVKFDQSEVNVAGWIPGHNWIGTVYEPIYNAVNGNVEQAGMFFGLIVFKLLMDCPDKTWGFGRYSLNGRKIESMTYFEVSNPI